MRRRWIQCKLVRMRQVDPARRFRDARSSVYAYMDEILIRCPRCRSLARVVHHPHFDPPWPQRPVIRPRRLACRACAYARDTTGHSFRLPGNAADQVDDPFFGQPLWLQTSTAHGLLWAYNLRHLTVIEQYVAASLREDTWADTGLRMTMFAKLPAWLKRAHNRDENLRAIARLRSSVVN